MEEAYLVPFLLRDVELLLESVLHVDKAFMVLHLDVEGDTKGGVHLLVEVSAWDKHLIFLQSADKESLSISETV